MDDAEISDGKHGVAFLPRPLRHKVFVYTITDFKISFDQFKRDITIAERGLDFASAAQVFAGVTYEIEDKRNDYGETRIICYGMLDERMVVVGYTPRGATRHVFSMRKANEREQTRIAPLLQN